VIFTRYLNNPRATPPEELALLGAGLTGLHYQVCSQPAAAWAKIRSIATPEDLICVTGSFFIAAEIRRMINDQ